MEKCIICLEDDSEFIFEDGCPLNKCNVKHCGSCKEIISRWIEMNNSCPKCRRLIKNFKYEKYEYIYILLIIIPGLLCIFSKTFIVPVLYYTFLCMMFLMCIMYVIPDERMSIFHYMILCNIMMSLLGCLTFLLIIICIMVG